MVGHVRTVMDNWPEVRFFRVETLAVIFLARLESTLSMIRSQSRESRARKKLRRLAHLAGEITGNRLNNNPACESVSRCVSEIRIIREICKRATVHIHGHRFDESVRLATKLPAFVLSTTLLGECLHRSN